MPLRAPPACPNHDTRARRCGTRCSIFWWSTR
jgi:hypothetical protein